MFLDSKHRGFLQDGSTSRLASIPRSRWEQVSSENVSITWEALNEAD